MKKVLNYLAIMIIPMVPVLLLREYYLENPNNYPILQWLWVVVSYWILAPFLVIKKDAHVGIDKDDPNQGNFKGSSAIYMFLLVLIIWTIIWFTNG